jgi:predicted GIY-YIG superfamily endonuclease
MKRSWVYILRCSDGSYYVGCTTSLDEGIAQHQEGLFPGYTAARKPVELLWCEEFSDIWQAIEAERQLKGWSRKKKEALMDGRFDLLHELARCKNATNSEQRETREKLLSNADTD